MIYKCTIKDLYWLKDILPRSQAAGVLSRPECTLYHIGDKSVVLFKKLTRVMWEAHIYFQGNLRQVSKDCKELPNIIFNTTDCIKTIVYLPNRKKSIINMCKNIGMKYEGTLKNSEIYEDSLIDLYIYSINKEN